MTLKCGFDHWKWYEQAELNEWYHHAKFNIYLIHGVQENRNDKVFSTGTLSQPKIHSLSASDTHHSH